MDYYERRRLARNLINKMVDRNNFDRDDIIYNVETNFELTGRFTNKVIDDLIFRGVAKIVNNKIYNNKEIINKEVEKELKEVFGNGANEAEEDNNQDGRIDISDDGEDQEERPGQV